MKMDAKMLPATVWTGRLQGNRRPRLYAWALWIFIAGNGVWI